SCGVLCPCWVGADPDGGTCDSFNAYHFDRGTIRGADVSGPRFINAWHTPGNVLAPGSWRVGSFVDERASDEQCQAILDAYHGRLGGPPAHLAGLVGGGAGGGARAGDSGPVRSPGRPRPPHPAGLPVLARPRPPRLRRPGSPPHRRPAR